jgi:uncharacterized protein
MENSMRRLFGVFALAACLAAPAHAQDTVSREARQKARELAALMTGPAVGQVTNTIAAQIWTAIEREVAGKIDAATLAEMRTEFERTLRSFTEDVVKEAPTIYARHFSAQELSDLLAFYRSPTGAKALREMPKVLADVTSRLGPRMQAVQSSVNEKMKAILRKHGYKG